MRDTSHTHELISTVGKLKHNKEEGEKQGRSQRFSVSNGLKNFNENCALVKQSKKLLSFKFWNS